MRSVAPSKKLTWSFFEPQIVIAARIIFSCIHGPHAWAQACVSARSILHRKKHEAGCSEIDANESKLTAWQLAGSRASHQKNETYALCCLRRTIFYYIIRRSDKAISRVCFACQPRRRVGLPIHISPAPITARSALAKIHHF